MRLVRAVIEEPGRHVFLGGRLEICRDEGMTEVLVTCMAENTGSRRVIEANGGVLEPGSDGICRYWIKLSGAPAA